MCSRNGAGYGYPGADGCVGAQSTGIPALASVALPAYRQPSRASQKLARALALNRGQQQALEQAYRRYSENG